MKAINIKWDITDEAEEMTQKEQNKILASLPKEVDLSTEFSVEDYDDEEEMLDDISDWLSDNYGYCHNGFELEY